MNIFGIKQALKMYFVTDIYIYIYIYIDDDNFWVILYPFCAEVSSGTIIVRIIMTSSNVGKF